MIRRLLITAAIGLALAPAADAQNVWRPERLTKFPPHTQQFLDICHAEQPRPGTDPGRGTFANIWWHQTVNYSYKGGCGFTQANWDQFKRPGQPKYMNQASPLEQLWACWRIYRHYARIGGPAYGASVWDASSTIGFYGFNEAS